MRHILRHTCYARQPSHTSCNMNSATKDTTYVMQPSRTSRNASTAPCKTQRTPCNHDKRHAQACDVQLRRFSAFSLRRRCHAVAGRGCRVVVWILFLSTFFDFLSLIFLFSLSSLFFFYSTLAFSFAPFFFPLFLIFFFSLFNALNTPSLPPPLMLFTLFLSPVYASICVSLSV